MIWEDDVYLMVDENLVASQDNTSMVREEARRRAENPVIDADDRALFDGEEGYRTWVSLICRDGGRYRMWYTFQPASARRRGEHATRGLRYAESDDGITFKPVTIRRGKGNHAEFDVASGVDKGLQMDRYNRESASGMTFKSWGQEGVFGGAMMHDPADKEWPYKRLLLRRGGKELFNPAFLAKYPKQNAHWASRDMAFPCGIARSRDGFDWEIPACPGVLADAIIEGPNLYRAMDGGLVISNQMHSQVEDIQWRKIKGWVTYDGQTGHRIPGWIFALPDHMTMVQPMFLGSETWAGTPWIQSHVGLVPAKKGPSMLALNGYLYGAIGTETFAQVSDVGLLVSDTGYWFKQVWPFRPFLQRGQAGAWDGGLVHQHALVDDNDETRIYYGASDIGNAAGTHYYVGVATIPRDRYGFRCLRVYRDYFEAKARRGVVTLKPLTLPAKPALAVNVTHVTRTRTVRAELRDGKGRVIPGFSFRNCRPVTREGIRQPLKWNNTDAAKLGGREVSVSLELESPDCQYADQDSPRLYAFYAGK